MGEQRCEKLIASGSKNVWRLNQGELTQTKEEIRWSKDFYWRIQQLSNLTFVTLEEDGTSSPILHTENTILAINGRCKN